MSSQKKIELPIEGCSETTLLTIKVLGFMISECGDPNKIFRVALLQYELARDKSSQTCETITQNVNVACLTLSAHYFIRKSKDTECIKFRTENSDKLLELVKYAKIALEYSEEDESSEDEST